MNKRDLLAKIVPNRIKWFDRVNDNADYVRVCSRFDETPKFSDRFGMYGELSPTVQDLTVDYLEFGVWQGASIAQWAKLLRNSNSRLHGFDTFSGLPEDWIENHPKGTFNVHGAPPKTDDARIEFHAGLFQVTLLPFLNRFKRREKMIVHIDCDLYSATLFVLATLNSVLQSGDLIIFDDFHSVDHEFYAFFDYERSFYRRWSPVAAVTRCTSVAIRLD